MNDIIYPVFPLQVAAFPGEILPLHIFEPRYRLLVADCEASGMPFVIIAIDDEKITRLGTAMRIEAVANRNEDGTMDIITRGIGVVKVQSWLPSPVPERYHRARVDELPDDVSCPDDIKEQLREMFALLIEAIQTPKKPNLPPSDQPLSYQFGPYCGLEVSQKVELLSIRNETMRAAYLIQHIADLIKKIEAVARIQERVQQNGHYKVLPGVDFDFSQIG